MNNLDPDPRHCVPCLSEYTTQTFNPETLAIHKEILDQAFDILDNADKLLRDIIVLRYGLNGLPHTYKEISEKLGICDGRIIMLEARALSGIKKRITAPRLFKGIKGMKLFRPRGGPPLT